MQGHTGSITAFAALLLGEQNRLVVVSAAGDEHVLVWHCQMDLSSSGAGTWAQQCWTQQLSIQVGLQLQNCIAVASLPDQPDW